VGFVEDFKRWLGLSRPSRPRILALLAFHDEMRFLPGFFQNVVPEVDGIVALDDGSTDGSGHFVARQPGLLELLAEPPRTPYAWDESVNRRRLIEAAGRHRPDWLVAVDADERLERGFGVRARAEIARAEAAGIAALSVHVRELWGSPETYRADGIWGTKRFARFFRHRPDPEIDPRTVHGHWAPLNSKTDGGFPAGDLYLYHLKMIDAADRQARRQRYERMDPDSLLQPIGYAYLTDESGLRLEPLIAGRGYQPLGR
jgi:glycosyltransferase involved in cell wall biosynthesis